MSSNEGNDQPADISNLQENFSKQQKKIYALKELVRKSEVAHGKSTSSAQEKVKNIAQRLTLLKSKARSRKSLDTSEQSATTAEIEANQEALSQSHISIVSPSPSNISTPNPTPIKPQEHSESNVGLAAAGSAGPGSEKFQLLRQQMQQNKELMAKRASSKQHLEQLVTQLKEKFDSTQQYLEDTNELGKSMTNLSALPYTSVTHERHKSATDLSTQPFSLEKERIKFLENRCRLLEKQLEKEKQANVNRDASLNDSNSSQAFTKRIKELENKVVELEESLKEEQEKNIGSAAPEVDVERLRADIIAKDEEISNLRMELDKRLNIDTDKDLHTENERLCRELQQQLQRISELESINDMLETTRNDLEQKTKESAAQIKQLEAEVDTAGQRLKEAEEELEQTQEKYASLQADFNNLKSEQGNVTAETAVTNTDAEVTAEMAKRIQELQDEIDIIKVENGKLKEIIDANEKIEVSDASIAEKIANLEATIESQRDDLNARMETVQKQKEELMEKTIELNVLNANFKVLEEKLQTTSKNKPLFSSSGADEDVSEAKAEIQQLKSKLDESNKAMIKLKLKCKQTEKQMEKLRKSSDLHAEVVKLEKLNEELQQKVVELEDEKGQWQLTQMDDVKHTTEVCSTDTTTTTTDLEEQNKKQAETIRLLEEQKYEQSENLERIQQELHALQNQLKQEDSEECERVKSEMSEIQFEEKIEEQEKELRSIKDRLEQQQSEIEELQHKLDETQCEKQAVDKKLEHYINENMELLDKVEKLSKSSSSAESIEIVERLTQQERAEIDEFNKRLEQEHTPNEHTVSSVSEVTQTEMGLELNENFAKLREESSELLNKIELFTTERREVLEKMEQLTAENHDLIRKVEELTEQKDLMETNALLADNAKSKLESQLQELKKEKELLASQVAESTAQKAKLSQELTSMQKSSEVMAAIDSSEGATLFDKCEKSLSKLNSELEAYRKANDKNAKFNASKKLAKEAKNAHTQLSELLQKVKEASTAVETVTVVETVVAVTAPNGKALAEYEQLTAQNRELKATVDDLRRELQEVRDSFDDSTVQISEEVPAIKQEQNLEADQKLQKALQDINEYEEQCVTLQSTVEDLRRQLREALLASDERSEEITQLNEELTSLKAISADFDRVMNDKDLSFEKQIEQLTRLRKELEGKCETYEGEMEILQTLVTEQKQQLIEAYKENEHEINLKLIALEQRDEEIVLLRAEIAKLKQQSAATGDKLSNELQKECESLREKLKIEKMLVTEQINELSNKQETIDALNQQITDLYKTMEDNINKVFEMESEMTALNDSITMKNEELVSLRKDNDEQKTVVDKLLGELHSHRTNIPQLEADIQRLEQANKQLEETSSKLEQRNKEQLEKMKKYAANLKKRATQCLEFESKIKELEKGATEALQSKEHTESNTAEIERLQEGIQRYEVQLKESELSLNEIKEALQVKTLEQLETHEVNTQLKQELEKTNQQLLQKSQEVIQLQNALSASQEQMSDWGNAESTEMLEKNNKINQLEVDLQQATEQLMEKTKDIADLRNELTIAQSQVSDWGADSFESTNNEQLSKELADKTSCLLKAEQDLNEVQMELMQMRESEKERQQAISELRQELKQNYEFVSELEKQITASEMKQGDEVEQLQGRLQAQEQRLSEVTEELKAKSLKFEKSKAVIKERNNQIQRLQTQLKDLQDKLSAQPEEEPLETIVPSVRTQLSAAPSVGFQQQQAGQVAKEDHEALQKSYNTLKTQFDVEKANFQETIARLETLHDGIQAKLQEDLSYIETLEQENGKFKEKICKLEECVAVFEERRASMERRANLLDEQLQTRTNEYEKTEDELIYRLNMLSEHDDVIGRRLLESQEEKEELLTRLEHTQTELNTLKERHGHLEKDYKAYKETNQINHEAEKNTLSEQLASTSAELQHLRNTYDAKLAAKSTEIDELECELSEQLQKINAEKRALMEDLEKSSDECSALKDEIVRVNESLNAVEQAKQELDREVTWLRMQNDNTQQDQYELQELRMQTLQDKTEIDNLRHQIDTLAANHEMELQALRTQIAELDTLRMQVGQNQTDDQVFIETENKRLTDLLAEKDTLIENYQRQNLQLQMAAASAAASTTQPQQQQHSQDPFAVAFGLPPATASNVSQDDRERLERDLSASQVDNQSLRETNSELQRQLQEMSREIENLRSSTAASASHVDEDVIPAPPMFFAGDQIMPSPFDEIMQVRTVDALEGAAMTRHRNEQELVGDAGEQPTIEDLQRNVSDLEKHAQDLEHKLSAWHQREAEYEERAREMELRAREREQQLHQLQLELQAKEKQQTEAFQKQISVLEAKLQEKDQRVLELQTKLSVPPSETEALNRLQELQNNLSHLQTLLTERDEELQNLKRSLDEEKHMKDTINALESQIIPDPIVETEVDGATPMAAVQPTLDMFFGGSSAPEFEQLVIPSVSNVPVIEEEIVPKKAYLCYPTGDPTQVASPSNVMLDLGSDWGDSWSTNEAAAEAAHFSETQSENTASMGRQSLVPREQQLEIQLQEELEHTKELQLALERCEQQKQELQVKSGKMVKKLKEYKTKMDELQASVNTQSFRKSTSVESNSMFSDLDAAIQEELKMQLKNLESKLEEQQKQQEQHTVEKEKLLKRIDTLIAGNERMVQLKEHQDMEVQMYQNRIRELQEKLNCLGDWGESESPLPPPQNFSQVASAPPPTAIKQSDSGDVSLKQKIADLSAEIQDINGDRQELQALLDEEKANSARADETIRTLLQKIAILDNATAANENVERSKYNDLKLEYQNLKCTYENSKETEQKLTAELEVLKLNCDELTQQITTIRSELIAAEETIKKLQSEVQTLRQKVKSEEEEYTDSKLEACDLRERNYELSETNKELEGDVVQDLKAEIEQLRTERDELLKQNEDLYVQIAQKVQPASDNGTVEELRGEIERLKRQIQTSEEEFTDCQLQAVELRTRNYEMAEANKELLVSEEKLRDLQLKLNSLEMNNAELRTAKDLLSAKLLEMEKEAMRTGGDDMSAQLLEKEAEIVHLKQRVEDLIREDQTEKLVLEILSKNQEIQLLKMQVKNLEEDKQDLEHNLSVHITKELQSGVRDEGQQEVAQLSERVQSLERQLQEAHAEKSSMEEELKVLNNHVLSSLEQEDKMKATVLELDTKNIEIAELRKSLETIKASGGADGNTAQAQLDVAALNAQWEAVVEQKCGEIAQMWREHLENREREFKQIELGWQDQLAAIAATNAAVASQPQQQQHQQQGVSTATTATSTPVSVSTSASASVSSSAAVSKDGTPLRTRYISEVNERATEDQEAAADAIIEKMQAALESQEMEIVTLKEQLAIRSAEYARLAAQYDPFKLQTTLSHSGMSTVSGPTSLDSSYTKRQNTAVDNASVVPKTDLDLALYMLHQRDMRCEEMTLELVSLLAERDTLQLKLSNTLRQLEDFREKTVAAGHQAVEASANVNVAAVSGAASTASTTSATDSPTRSAVAAGAIVGAGTVDDLNAKLSQLQTVNHSKDKLIVEEREQRIRQMERIQQDVAKMPSAAVSELVGADMSQTSQSPSSVLLNWLWGGSKPHNPTSTANTSSTNSGNGGAASPN